MKQALARVTAVSFCACSLLAQKTSPPSELQKAAEEFKIETTNLGLRPDSSPQLRKKAQNRTPFHGRLFENVRNDLLDAIPHEIRQNGGEKSLLRRNQFGFNLTGPVFIPKVYDGGQRTFFSVSFEGVRERIARSYLTTVATNAERTGDFSSTVDDAGNVLPVYDPKTTRLNPNFDPTQPVTVDNLQYLRDPFPGNKIPQNQLDPVSMKATSYYPMANTDVGPFAQNNYFTVSPERNEANGMIAKVDHTVNDQHRISTTLSFSNGFAGAAHYFNTAADPAPADRNFASRRGTLDYIYTVSAHTLNTITFDANSSSSVNVVDQSTNYATQLGLSGISGESFPVLSLGAYLSMGRANPDSRTANNTYTLTDSFSTRRGKHRITITGQLVDYQVNTYLPTYPSGYLGFDAGLTSLPGIVDTGHAFASFLLGLSDSAIVSAVQAPSYFRRSSGVLSINEAYQAKKNLSISVYAGLDVSTPRTEKYNRQSTIDLNAINPANGLPGAMIVAGQNGVGGAFQPTMVKCNTSVGISWNPRGDSKTVVSLSFGRSYSEIPIYASQWGTQAFNAQPTYSSQNTQLYPAVTLSGGFPPLPYSLPDLQSTAVNNLVADLVDSSGRQPTYQSAGLSIQRELPGSILITGSFSYSGGKNLLVGNNDANPDALPISTLGYRDQLNNQTFNLSLRPYPQYLGFDVYAYWPQGRYQRDAGSVRVEKRISKGLSLIASYEYSKQMDDYSGPYGVQDFFNLHNEWSLTVGNHPNVFSLSYVYELPIGSNKFLSFTDWRKYVIDGWSVSGVTTMYSGDPIYLHPEFNNTGGVFPTLNVNVVPGVNPSVSNPGPNLWFNPAAFDQPADFTMGNASRTSPTLRNPGIQNHDVSITKRFTLGPERTLELTALGLNFVNHANWNYPDNVIGSATAPNLNAGKIIGSHGGRVVQVGLRLSF